MGHECFPSGAGVICWFDCRLHGCTPLVHQGVLDRVFPAAAPAAVFLLGVGGAAEHLADRLSDGVPVNAEDAEQLAGLAAARHLGHCQALDGEAGFVHHSRAHRLTETTWGIGTSNVRSSSHRISPNVHIQVFDLFFSFPPPLCQMRFLARPRTTALRSDVMRTDRTAAAALS